MRRLRIGSVVVIDPSVNTVYAAVLGAGFTSISLGSTATATYETGRGPRLCREGQLGVREGDSPDDYRAGIDKLRADGLIAMHDSGTFLKFTAKGAERSA
jgi:hypothetical protein